MLRQNQAIHPIYGTLEEAMTSMTDAELKSIAENYATSSPQAGALSEDE